MSASVTSAQAPAPPHPNFLARRRVWQVCYLAALRLLRPRHSRRSQTKCVRRAGVTA
jgi:hypothetical protein